ncbi:hypothetical protein BCT30_16060 [Enterovibrio norvegicus]|uniref:sel1 repeat family protein n=1 Tax=Enterovibrio norvegicus TaxID=188144 RepID=UPI000C864636|nr:sel1 repeat family protein [Enterovibrio norvegicus]MCC4800332.1 sel1 repeat family protein [Enterovibrio norvegicus]PMH61401.1 hypothetical protein BCU62_20550 [Enterovibrio norvegicus]PMI30829.1 hypothetical protein BCU47_16990 [Enterovibrio norvegicus]PMI36742.1 hypothetical protein BCU46_13225 [Enterovibrio norvegicus]PMN51127.1 hypothetical protein BCT30_16060 [Enterovibrio norvegicus]
MSKMSILPFMFISLTACSEEPTTFSSGAFSSGACPSETNYSPAFLKSDFYSGWKQLHGNGTRRANCKAAMRYFSRGVSQGSVFELSALYLDYCDDGSHILPLANSSIYTGEKQENGIDYDEFKWVLDLALCDSPIEQYALGNMLVKGFITDKDIQKGIYFLSLSAHQEYVHAQVSLAQALVVEGETDVAALWLEKAKENGAHVFAAK